MLMVMTAQDSPTSRLKAGTSHFPGDKLPVKSRALESGQNEGLTQELMAFAGH